MPDSRLTSQTVRYRERLWVPWWWWPAGMGLAAVLAATINMGIRGLPDWSPYAVSGAAAAGVLLWLSRVEIRVVDEAATGQGADDTATGQGADDTATGVELVAGDAHLPASVVTRSAAVPRSAKSAALGRQLDPAAFVLHRTWVGPMVLVVLDDPDDPTPYWLVSTRRPEKVLSALRS